MSDTNQYERYQRQILLKEFGEAGQKKLLEAKALVIGAGGLGCAVLPYLTGAGVGTIGIVDDDVVSLTNLHRQVLFCMNDIGSSKAEVAAARMKQLNPELNIVAYNFRLTNKNALEIFEEYDIIIDGTDNFSSRYLVNDACVLLNKPLIYGAVSQFEGQVAVFNLQTDAHQEAVNYRDLFPYIPNENEILNCAEAGVLGVLPGIIGCLQANEAIKVITHIGKPLVNRLLVFNALTNDVHEFNLSKNLHANNLLPKSKAAFQQAVYDWVCVPHENANEINTEDFDRLLHQDNVTIVDVREQYEQPLVTEFNHQHIPLLFLKEQQSSLKGDNIILFCQTGRRSLQGVQLLKESFNGSKKIYSLKGGILEWKKSKQEL